jgi:hypothetical protein
VQQVQKRHDAAAVRHEVEGVVPLRVGDGGVRAVRDEELEDVEVAAAGGPLEGRSDEVTAEGVDVGAGVEQQAARGELGVDCGPVQWRDVLGVAVCCTGAARVEQGAEGGDVAALGSDEDVCLVVMLLLPLKKGTGRTSSSGAVWFRAWVKDKSAVALSCETAAVDAVGGGGCMVVVTERMRTLCSTI